MEATDLSVGVLGLGSIGQRHARNLLALGCSVAGFDSDPKRAEALSGNNFIACKSRAEVLGQVNALVIASPSGNHFDDLASAIGAGKPVFIEKPLAHLEEGLENLLRAADKQGLVVFSGFNLRFHPAVLAARDLILSGMIGQPIWARLIAASYLPDWRPHQDYRQGYFCDPASGGIILDGIHELDLACFLLGRARLVFSLPRRSGLLDVPTEDCADIILKHENGAISSLHMDVVTRPRRRMTEIAGTRGILHLDLDRRHLSAQGLDGEFLFNRQFEGTYADDYVLEMQSFLRSVRAQENFFCDGWEALATLRLALKARHMGEDTA